MGWLRVRALLVLPVLCLMIPTARADPEFRKTANLMVLSEALLTQSKVIGEKFGKDFSQAEWQSSFSDRLWSAKLSGMVAGKASTLSLTGFAWDGDQESLIVAFSGTGEVGGEPVLVHGNATWISDPKKKDYLSMDFQQVTRLGTGTEWFWSRGAETIVGGTLGGALGVGALVILMKDTSPRDIVWALKEGAALGSSTLVSLSKTVMGRSEGGAPPAPPAMPTRPAALEDTKVVPAENTLIVVKTGDGRVIGNADNAQHVLDGKYSLETGQASGSILLRK